MTRVLVTGANGFVGRNLIPVLVEKGFEVVAAVRHQYRHEPSRSQVVEMPLGDFTSVDGWSSVLRDVDAVVHLSARVHIMNDVSTDLYRLANVDVTRRLAHAAADAGCRRFVFASSIKVNGESTAQEPFTASDAPNPQDAYGISKMEAEQVLRAAADRSGMQLTIIRMPLVYGPGVGGNFLRMIKLVSRGIWLPFGAIENRRSLIGVQNLCHFICHDLATQPSATVPALISDARDVSTPELIRHIATALQVRARLLTIPVRALRIVAATLRMEAETSRLCESLCVDPVPTMETWSWRPPFSMAHCMNSTAAWFREQYG